MSQQHSVDKPADGPPIVAWGDEPRAPGRISRFTTTVRRGRRLGPTVAALGTVAIFASLVTEWAVTTLPGASPDGRGPLDVPHTVNDIGSFGTAYLVGVLALAGCVTLVLFGTPAIRRNVRVGGLTLAAALLVILGALAASLGRIMNRYFFSGGETLVVDYGRGLVTAFVGVAALGAALLLARSVEPDAAGTTPGSGATVGPEPADGPADLIVMPAQAFAGPDAAPPVTDAQPRENAWEQPWPTPPGETERYRRESRSGPR
ncbi:hypothetical protein [Micromonospora sp. NPDC049679]|uniref:hypothetical protein n=1 Tax=Micromonospora sp. NPDC049679 TaxID=3155920 RepID=UPI0033FB5BCE